MRVQANYTYMQRGRNLSTDTQLDILDSSQDYSSGSSVPTSTFLSRPGSWCSSTVWSISASPEQVAVEEAASE
ncbi:unnamed protein product [Meloidogyne enterolobii]|uniref:Uncharacterized protein n=1 Tax=Meloidogyne enterolobii TaxID=390850 RepID=A0ACB0YL68_MELEN